uniref:Uncharacterized protein n=1 Tax=Setaria viridis TaxID=4556 RepID=A0A4V6D5S2_SETVI|nr:hypothetical protein SEVIR_6G241850v2 [Setaria viridis]
MSAAACSVRSGPVRSSSLVRAQPNIFSSGGAPDLQISPYATDSHGVHPSMPFIHQEHRERCRMHVPRDRLALSDRIAGRRRGGRGYMPPCCPAARRTIVYCYMVRAGDSSPTSRPWPWMEED